MQAIARISHVSIRVKVMVAALAAVLLSGAAIIGHARYVIAEAVGQQLDERAISIGKALALRSQDLILTGDTFALYGLVREVVRANRDIRYALIVGPEGEVIAHTFDQGVPGDLLRLNSSVSKEVRLMKLSTEEGIIRDAAAPVVQGVFVKVGISQRLLDESIAAGTRRMTLSVLMNCVAALLLAYILATSLKRSCEEVERNQKDKTRLLRRIISVQEEERQRIARELHDETGQTLAAVSAALGAITNGKDRKKRAEEAQAMVTQAMDRVKNLAFNLRPGLLDDLGLMAAVERYVEDFMRLHGLPVSVQGIGVDERRLPQEVETSIYRIVQEALLNSAKHAGASHASVTMQMTGRSLRVLIEDDGRGFDVQEIEPDEGGRSLGLFGMRERAALIGGTLKVESSPGLGTTIAVDVPFGNGK